MIRRTASATSRICGPAAPLWRQCQRLVSDHEHGDVIRGGLAAHQRGHDGRTCGFAWLGRYQLAKTRHAQVNQLAAALDQAIGVEAENRARRDLTRSRPAAECRERRRSASLLARQRFPRRALAKR
jgi:hypothetical protein